MVWDSWGATTDHCRPIVPMLEQSCGDEGSRRYLVIAWRRECGEAGGSSIPLIMSRGGSSFPLIVLSGWVLHRPPYHVSAPQPDLDSPTPRSDRISRSGELARLDGLHGQQAENTYPYLQSPSGVFGGEVGRRSRVHMTKSKDKPPD